MSTIRVLVQKFGGSSLAEPDGRRRAVEHVRRARSEGWNPVVVVSAFGRRGDPYATDTLLELWAGPAEPRETDLLLACGEVMAAVRIAGMLRDAGLPAVALTGGQAGIVTDSRFGEAEIREVSTERLVGIIERGAVPVVAGFQGQDSTGEVTTLGRGGSDTTAVALGVALSAELVEIFTDVDGIKTADPTVLPEAVTIGQLAYEESFELASQGARVIHPRAVEMAWRNLLPLRIRSTFETRPGTLVTSFRPGRDPWVDRRSDRAVTGLSARAGLAQVIVDGGAALRPEVFAQLAAAGISLDIINIFPDRQAFAVDLRDLSATEDILRKGGFPHRAIRNLAKVTAVGSAIHGLPGVMAHVLGALAEEGVAVLATADSQLSISCLVHESDLTTAVRALHRRFALERTVAATALTAS